MTRLTLLSFIIVVAGALWLSACGNGGTAVSNGNTAVDLTTSLNNLRTNAGVSPFTTSASMTFVAQSQADFNFNQGTNGTTDVGGLTIQQQLANAGMHPAELVTLTGSGNAAEALSAFDASNHADLVSSNFTLLGVGTAGTGADQRWVAILAQEQNP